ncbi:MAG: heparinase II/III family protein [Phycisphaerae bacterium]|jgi:hypothetical protein
MTVARTAAMIALTLALAATAVAQPAISRQTYLDLAIADYDASQASCHKQVEEWKKDCHVDPIWGYSPPAGPVWQAGLGASLYELTGDEKYATDAAEWLAALPRYKDCLPASAKDARPEYADGLPTLTNFFHLAVYCQAYHRLGKSPALTPERRAAIEQGVVESAEFILRFPEWGPMNRAILRAEGLAWAAKVLPEHKQARTWREAARMLASDSWGHWSEEDASLYHPVWLHALIRYADVVEDPSLFAKPTTRYYFEYFLHLMSPASMVGEFGDARWNASWPYFIVCLERGASEYQQPELKWAAARIFTTMTAEKRTGLGAMVGLMFTDAYRWADDKIEARQPTAGSEEVLEDLIGKKIVFRNGWGDRDTYLLLNYRDEGDFARVPRDYLRHTIPVEEEKMHHGHSDENAICMLMCDGSVLLDEAGYRDAIPSGPYGAFRADYFHNRLVARRYKPGREQPLFEFLRHSGGYESVRTEKIGFFNFADVDVSRTRVTDERTGCVHDRVIAYLKRDQVFVVFDIVKVLETDFYTFTTLWHTTTILNEGPQYYDTAIDYIGDCEPPQNKALLIAFPFGECRQCGTFPISRRKREATAIYQKAASHYLVGDTVTFVTVLVPHDRGADTAPLLAAIEPLPIEPAGAGLGVRLKLGDEEELLCVNTDLSREVLSANVRPRYTFESGRVAYGPIETDASFFYARRADHKLTYAGANLVRAIYDGQEVFSARLATFSCQPDTLVTGHGLPKWRFWEDSATLK